ncbi:MAG: hypothetical protein LUD84_06510 [Clostridiales bacterium]|nr:hypothetical protein [Clostridiales bacterium]
MNGYDEIQAKIDAVGDLLQAYSAEIVCCVPLFILFVLGANSAPIWAYILTVLLLVVLVIVCNPFSVLNGFLAPQSRKFLSVGIVVAVLAVIFPWLSLYARACLLLLAAGLIVLAVWKRKAWLSNWQVMQSPEVDSTLSHLKHGGEFAASKYWEKQGMQETRALLHQALGVECNEVEIERTYKAIFFLAFLSGQKKSKQQVKKLKAQVKQKDETIAAQKQELYTIRKQDVEILQLRQDNSNLEYKVQSLMQSKAQAENRAKALEEQVQDLSLTQEERDAAIVAFIDAGEGNYKEAGLRYGLTKNGAVAAYRRAKQATTKQEPEKEQDNESNN